MTRPEAISLRIALSSTWSAELRAYDLMLKERYEYDGEIRQIARDRQIDVNNGVERYAFIQDFVVTHIDGIRLRNDDRGYVCPKCGTRSRSAMLGDRPVRRRGV